MRKLSQRNTQDIYELQQSYLVFLHQNLLKRQDDDTAKQRIQKLKLHK